MALATYLLFLLGCLGATDILLYHSFSHGIRTHPGSRHELITHSLRGPTYAALFVLVPNFAMTGVWFWMLLAALVVDAAISVWDFAVERESRRLLGGLPSGEYVLHMIMAMLFGALVAVVWSSAGVWRSMPTGITYAPAAVPVALRMVMAIMAPMVLYSGYLDLRAARRLTPSWS